MARSATADGLEWEDRLKGTPPSNGGAYLDMTKSSRLGKEARDKERLLILALQGDFPECIEVVGREHM